ncbi:hypothetical protein [Bacillus amyloliquefaciens]|uniref:hypothetical protein n=1 Tax=Bacillus amyloliquefaciens TaxID=1390 RepID=UPI0026706DA7|nr:hypothetical protein [Bacillus amyloliquefaciens]WKT37420.1 hypothetical protein Q2B68_07090 [Bacillus amyloliquefaciens]WKT37511.1 hypothetical protein Q2B68_07560 [Bacillus amyloliquefaciens]
MFSENELHVILDGLKKLDPEMRYYHDGEYTGTPSDLRAKVLRLINEGGDANHGD